MNNISKQKTGLTSSSLFSTFRFFMIWNLLLTPISMFLLEESLKYRAYRAITRTPCLPQPRGTTAAPSGRQQWVRASAPEAPPRCTLGVVVLRAAARPRPDASRLAVERGMLGAVVRPPHAASVRRGWAGGEGGELASGRLRPGGAGVWGVRPFSSWQGGMEAAWRQGGRGRGRARLGDGLSNRAGAAARPPAPVGRGGACVQMAASGGEGTCGECPSPPQPSGGARQPGLASEGRPQNGTGASGRARRTRVAVGPASAPLPAGASRGRRGPRGSLPPFQEPCVCAVSWSCPEVSSVSALRAVGWTSGKAAAWLAAVRERGEDRVRQRAGVGR